MHAPIRAAVSWTPETVWARILDAIETHGRLPGIDWPDEYGTSMPNIVRDWMAYQVTDPPPLVVRPSVLEEEGCADVMRWLTWIHPTTKKAILHRARGAGDNWIAKHVFSNGEYAHLVNGIIRAALMKIAARLNGNAR